MNIMIFIKVRNFVLYFFYVSRGGPALDVTENCNVIMRIIYDLFSLLQIVTRIVFYEVIGINAIKVGKIIPHCLSRHSKRELNLQM